MLSHGRLGAGNILRQCGPPSAIDGDHASESAGAVITKFERSGRVGHAPGAVLDIVIVCKTGCSERVAAGERWRYAENFVVGIHCAGGAAINEDNSSVRPIGTRTAGSRIADAYRNSGASLGGLTAGQCQINRKIVAAGSKLIVFYHCGE